jgi:hypothetical protein
MKFVAEQRAVQSAEFDIFVEAVTRRIALNAQDLERDSRHCVALAGILGRLVSHYVVVCVLRGHSRSIAAAQAERWRA